MEFNEIAIIGKGNVGSHLYKALKPHFNAQLYDSRDLDNFSGIKDVAIIGVKDDIIPDIAEKLKGKTHILCHTSGSQPMDILKPYSHHIGVIYPLQTFTKEIELNYADIPFFIEASDDETLKVISEIVSVISKKIKNISSSQRAQLHLAGVFACNFTNQMFVISKQILEKSGFGFEDIIPLLNQTHKKIINFEPEICQTGPAVRDDRGIINRHIQMLEEIEYKKLYELMSLIIKKNSVS